MQLQQSHVGDVKLLELVGSLTQDSTEKIGPEFAAALAGAQRIVVDFSSVDLVTTPGIAMLLAAEKVVRRASGKLVITGTHGLVNDLLKRCRLDVVLDIAPTRDEAFRRARL